MLVLSRLLPHFTRRRKPAAAPQIPPLVAISASGHSGCRKARKLRQEAVCRALARDVRTSGEPLPPSVAARWPL